MPERLKTVTIANGASLSGVIDLEGFVLMGIQMPSAWTAANLTFEASSARAGTFDDVYDDTGTEVNVTAAASRYIGVTGTKGDVLANVRFLKVRSGTTGTPVNQGAARTITLCLKGWGMPGLSLTS